MVNIVPREAYSVDESGIWRRMPWLSVAAYVIIAWIVSGPMRAGGVLSKAGLTVLLVGALYGAIFSKVLRWSMERMLDRLFRDDAKAAPAPPPGVEYSHRMPCSLSRKSGWTVGGTLYFGRNGFTFVPHRMNLPGDRASILVGPPEKLSFSTAPASVPAIARLLVDRVPELIVIGAEGAPELRLLAPRPRETLASLEKLAGA
jgi:hypothetical protein